MHITRRVPFRVAFAALLAAAVAALTIAPAQAVAYRYWGFYQLDKGAWAFAQKGPDQTVPTDGSVEGWRFAVGDESSSRLPRAVLTFEALCASTPAQSGSKRVGLVVDFGRPADSADGTTTPPAAKATCAVVPAAATSTDVLRTAGELRMDKGLICAVAGYPATDCGGEVKELSAAAKAADTPIQIAAPAATPTATPSGATSPQAVAATTTAASSSGGTSTAAYVIAGLVLLAILAFVVARSRAAARKPS
ncbi:hypothetical protein N865_14595 [Intrasporangium oryzae NRRL B-24470]|uniref:Uncharacterized protein n=1 Tax=Intrasporangium oryzae NRRL B-24470 TaxID=1386089 RepID=W9G6Z8_9MICO|nr:SCO2322 family protein [Intrasporangium oryzae]EWT00583.1 hypothetical protein N865_14595 [Intrasporangium oryzae NRRL B-24470]